MYKVTLEVIFKVLPTILLAYFNFRIMRVYKDTCERRRRMVISRGEEDRKQFAEERRLTFLLGSTSVLFLVCVSPMVFLNVTLSQTNLHHYPYQVYNALALSDFLAATTTSAFADFPLLLEAARVMDPPLCNLALSRSLAGVIFKFIL